MGISVAVTVSITLLESAKSSSVMKLVPCSVTTVMFNAVQGTTSVRLTGIRNGVFVGVVVR